jgi:aminopeptidase-like protein
MAMLQAGLTDPEGVKLFALKEGLDFAIWMEEEKSAYESVIRNILLLYGDGVTTQQIVLTPHTCRPDMQLRVLSSFMANPVMGMASPEVQDAFKSYRESLISFMGQSLPAMVPNPDDVANVNPGMMAGGVGAGAQPSQGVMNGQQ